MANNHLIDGLESQISRYNPTIIYEHKCCKICGGKEFIVFDGIYVCCKRCGVVAKVLSFQTSDINKAEPMGFHEIHKKKVNAKRNRTKMMKNAKRKIKKKNKKR